MPKSVKIASVVVISLLLVAVVVLLYQQSVAPRSAAPPTVTPGKPVAGKPTPYTPSTDITPERVPGTDSIDPNATPDTTAPRSPSGPLAIQAEAPGPTVMPAPATQQASLPPEPAGPTTAPATTAPSAPPAPLIVATPTTVPAKPAPPATAPAPEPLRTYTVKAGDTLTSIAQKNLGSESRWHEIAEANPMIDPIKLRIGQVLKMPVPAGAADTNGVKPTTQPRDPSGRIIYIVRPLDSLASIAKQYYGTRDLWKIIYSANRGSIGSDPDKLEPGTKLVIPPAPQPAR